jgi:hypothetical protein
MDKRVMDVIHSRFVVVINSGSIGSLALHNLLFIFLEATNLGQCWEDRALSSLRWTSGWLETTLSSSSATLVLREVLDLPRTLPGWP